MQLTDPQHIRGFMFAGNATFTLVSKKTGTRYTYRIRKPESGPGEAPKPHFVQLLNGPDNEASYVFMGSFFANDPNTYRHGRKSTLSETAPSVRAFTWFWEKLLQTNNDPEALSKVEFWHEGRCCRCGRKLTVPSSIESGIGPECASKGW